MSVIEETYKEETTQQTDIPLYAIKIHDDNVHSYNYVIQCLIAVIKISYDSAFKFAYEIDHNGSAIVWSGYKEIGELKLEQILNFGKEKYGNHIVDEPLRAKLIKI